MKREFNNDYLEKFEGLRKKGHFGYIPCEGFSW